MVKDAPHDWLASTATDVVPGGQPASARSAPGFVRGQNLGRYVLIDHIGAGGFGVVYKAFDTLLDRAVALKLSHPELARSQSARARLLREARALAKLSHPNVVVVHDVGVVDELVFVATEFIDGVTLRDWLRAPRRFEELLSVFLAAGRGLAAAHAAGLVHRDFKPSNVMVASSGAVRVVDFGLARAVNGDAAEDAAADAGLPASTDPSGRLQTLTRAGAVVGTPAYMAPEQFAGERTDERTDVYSFCVALYEALSGELPYDMEPGREGLEAAVRAGKTRPLPAAVGAPDWLSALLAHGLRTDPADRPANMDAVVEVLLRRGGEAELGVDPVLVEPHFSNRIQWPNYEHLAAIHGMEAIAAAVAECGLTIDYLRDPSGWTSVTFERRLVEVLLRLYPGEPLRYDHPLYREWHAASRQWADRGKLGILAGAVAALGSPRTVYLAMASLIRLVNRVTEVTVEEVARDAIIIRARPMRADIADQPNWCWSRRGAFESTPLLFRLPYAELLHTACMHDPEHPAAECEYRVTYQDVGRRFLPAAIAAGGAVVAATAAWLAGGPAALIAGVALLGAVAADGWRRVRELRGYRDDAGRLRDAMLDGDRRYAELWKERQVLRGVLAARDSSTGSTGEGRSRG